MAEEQVPKVTREEVRPGLTMQRRELLKPDGRYLVYYDFIRSDPAQPGAAAEGGEQPA